MSAPLKTVIAGAAGRMGRTLAALVKADARFQLHALIEAPGHSAIGTALDSLAISDDALGALVHADALIDFTQPEGSVMLAGLAAQARMVHVIGTTGFSESDDARIKAAARHAVIIRSGNFSLGVNLLAALVQDAAARLGPEFDIEIAEMHHRHKVDAPSGTALLLGEAAAAGRGKSLAELRLKAREGHTGARPEGGIGFASLRGGSVVGDHTVTLAGPSERLALSHHAESREIFARGALHAALWGRGRGPGLYSMRDVLGL